MMVRLNKPTERLNQDAWLCIEILLHINNYQKCDQKGNQNCNQNWPRRKSKGENYSLEIILILQNGVLLTWDKNTTTYLKIFNLNRHTARSNSKNPACKRDQIEKEVKLVRTSSREKLSLRKKVIANLKILTSPE